VLLLIFKYTYFDEQAHLTGQSGGLIPTAWLTFSHQVLLFRAQSLINANELYSVSSWFKRNTAFPCSCSRPSAPHHTLLNSSSSDSFEEHRTL
jgi:hypothetical protein